MAVKIFFDFHCSDISWVKFSLFGRVLYKFEKEPNNDFYCDESKLENQSNDLFVWDSTQGDILYKIKIFPIICIMKFMNFGVNLLGRLRLVYALTGPRKQSYRLV